MLERLAATDRTVYWAGFALLALFSSVGAIQILRSLVRWELRLRADARWRREVRAIRRRFTANTVSAPNPLTKPTQLGDIRLHRWTGSLSRGGARQTLLGGRQSGAGSGARTTRRANRLRQAAHATTDIRYIISGTLLVPVVTARRLRETPTGPPMMASATGGRTGRSPGIAAAAHSRRVAPPGR